jgi:hypothetical protein
MEVLNCIFLVLVMAFGIALVVEFVRLVICQGIWWGRIRYDFPYYENDNPEAYRLYFVVLFAWILPIISFVSGSLALIFKHYELRFLWKVFVTTTILVNTAEIVVVILTIVFSTPSKCAIIKEKGTYPGNETEGYKKWYENQVKDKSGFDKTMFDINLPKFRCDQPHYTIALCSFVFALSLVLSIIFVLLAMWCNREKHPEFEKLTDNTRIGSSDVNQNTNTG